MKDDSKFFEWQSLAHLILFLWLSFVLTAILGWQRSLVICVIFGFVIEIVQMLDWWDRFMKKIGENEGKAHSISWKDIITNFVGTGMGIAMYLVI